MKAMTLGAIAEATGGTLVDGAAAHTVVSGSVEFDSRKVGDGGLFVAIPGARVDGHDFSEQAIAKGAVAMLGAHPTGVPAVIVPKVDAAAAAESGAANAEAFANDPTGEVRAVITGLSNLARANTDALTATNRKHPLTVIGVTGSAGKTSTKDFIATVVGQVGTTVAPPGSFNNEIGHPYTALRCDEDTRFLVSELSARGIGHIAYLARIAPPRIGAVLNVGTAHLGEFGSRENIAKAKGELVEALPSAADGGVAILNGDDPLVAGMAERTQAKVLYFSVHDPDHAGRPVEAHPDPEVYATDVQLDAMARASFTLHLPNSDPQLVSLQVYGAHQVSNALAAAAVGRALGLDARAIARALSSHTAQSVNRMDVRTREDGVTIINDSYNANPDSMRAGIAALATTAAGRRKLGSAGDPEGGRSWALLGKMGELGGKSAEEHEALGEVLRDAQIDRLVAIGEGKDVEALERGARAQGITTMAVSSVAEAVDLLSQELQPGDVVLVKASYVDGLWRVAEGLLPGPRGEK